MLTVGQTRVASNLAQRRAAGTFVVSTLGRSRSALARLTSQLPCASLGNLTTACKPASPCPVPENQARRLSTRAASGSIESPMAAEEAILGGGCFWCVEACYNQLKGVQSAISGYAGGHVPNPTYEQVCDKKTGHAEVVKVTFDPSVVDYKTILRIFFTIHDPTTKDRQGNDVGPQYRSIIMFKDEHQKEAAEEVMKEVTEEELYPNPLVTELVPASTFYEAEKYHQRYYEQNPYQGYCQYVVGPKLSKFRAKWAKMLA